MKWFTALLTMAMAVCFVSATPAADKTFGTQWKFSAKPEKGFGLTKMKKSDFNVCTFRSNGTFSNGPIQAGTWWRDSKGKFQASVSQADLQRVVNDLYGPGVINISSVRQSKYKLREKLGKNRKPGKLKFSLKVRVHFNGDNHMDIKVRFKGLELP